MEIIPLGDRAADEYGWRVDPSYSPSACFAFGRDENGVERPLIYSFPRNAWLTAERNSLATELPFEDQQQLARLLAPNVQALLNASAGVRSGKTPVKKIDDPSDND